jgi:hypothetical protein
LVAPGLEQVELGVVTSGGDQLVLGANLCDPSVVENDHEVGAATVEKRWVTSRVMAPRERIFPAAAM